VNSSQNSVKIVATPIINGRARQCSEGVLPPSRIVGTSTTVIGYYLLSITSMPINSYSQIPFNVAVKDHCSHAVKVLCSQ
jgi:hypothetical protein